VEKKRTSKRESIPLSKREGHRFDPVHLHQMFCRG